MHNNGKMTYYKKKGRNTFGNSLSLLSIVEGTKRFLLQPPFYHHLLLLPLIIWFHICHYIIYLVIRLDIYIRIYAKNNWTMNYFLWLHFCKDSLWPSYLSSGIIILFCKKWKAKYWIRYGNKLLILLFWAHWGLRKLLM